MKSAIDNQSFDELATSGLAIVEGHRRRGDLDGYRRTLASFYPDDAHIIYELLQNAEDQRATEVTFSLREDGLEFRHNGPRPFSLGDVNAIVKIGESTKLKDDTKIGKFGVGFKAVFAYTNRPEIYSGEYSFAIENLMVPIRLEGTAISGNTRFWFPFERDDAVRASGVKSARVAFEEIKIGLSKLDYTALLFLRSISTIVCELPHDDLRIVERKYLSDKIVQVSNSWDDQSDSYWYRITGGVDLNDSQHSIAAAFALVRGPEGFLVQPTEGKLFVYFPASSERPGLRFHVHAPFGSTVARNSISADPGNDELIVGLARTVAAAFPAMRDEGLITDGLLEALPNDEDYVDPRLGVMRQTILEAFQTNSLTPTADGRYEPASGLLRSERQTRSVLDIEDANYLRSLNGSNGSSAGWVRDGEKRVLKFLSSLAIEDFGRGHIRSALSAAAGLRSGDSANWESWLSGRTDAQILRMYNWIGQIAGSWRDEPEMVWTVFGYETKPSWKHAPIIRVQTSGGIKHVPAAEANLPAEQGQSKDGLVVEALTPSLCARDNDQVKEALETFYKRFGVKPWDAVEQIDERLRNNRHDGVTLGHLDDLREVRRLLSKNPELGDRFSKSLKLLAVSADGTPRWVNPSRVYIDDPFKPTGLSALYESPRFSDPERRYRLSQAYKDVGTNVVWLARRLGAIDEIPLNLASSLDNKEFQPRWSQEGRLTEYGTTTDWVIRHFDLMIESKDERLLRSLWLLVISAPESRATAVYQANSQRQSHPFRSQVLQQLEATQWILCIDGRLRRPREVTLEDLLPEFDVPEHAPLLRSAGFDPKRVKSEPDLPSAADAARALGFDNPDVAARLAAALKRNPTKAAAFLDELENGTQHEEFPALPGAPSLNPGRRAALAREQARNAAARSYSARQRSLRNTPAGQTADSKAYLRALYTNIDGVLVCQVCRRAMPFKLDDGEYYFEAVEFARTDLEISQNRVALCPTCGAKYRTALRTPPQERIRTLLATDSFEGSNVEIEVILAGRAERIFFVAKHANELSAALEVCGGEKCPSELQTSLRRVAISRTGVEWDVGGDADE